MRPRLLFPALMALMFVLFISEDALAQKKGGPPPWAPAHGYRAKTRYVYFPQHNIYYDTQRSIYIYVNSGGNWEIGAKMPRGVNRSTLRDSRQVELRLNIDNPQRYNTEHLRRYRDRAAPDVVHRGSRGRL
jgi:hypothetical protein